MRRECANVGTITTTLPDGTRAIVEGVYTYRVDDAGHLAVSAQEIARAAQAIADSVARLAPPPDKGEQH